MNEVCIVLVESSGSITSTVLIEPKTAMGTASKLDHR
jgi:hypothetical protein